MDGKGVGSTCAYRNQEIAKVWRELGVPRDSVTQARRGLLTTGVCLRGALVALRSSRGPLGGRRWICVHAAV